MRGTEFGELKSVLSNKSVYMNGIEREFSSRADQRVLRWFAHVERMDEYRMSKRVLMAELNGVRIRGIDRD